MRNNSEIVKECFEDLSEVVKYLSLEKSINLDNLFKAYKEQFIMTHGHYNVYIGTHEYKYYEILMIDCVFNKISITIESVYNMKRQNDFIQNKQN